MLAKDNQLAINNWILGIINGKSIIETINQGRTSRMMIYNLHLDIINICEEYFKEKKIDYYIHKIKKLKDVFSIEIIDDNLEKLLRASETTSSVSADIKWLVGLFQADGKLILNQNNWNIIKPAFIIEIVNESIIEKTKITLKEFNLPCHYRQYIPTVHKPYIRITIEGVLRCKRFLEETKDLWLGKRDLLKTSLIYEFIISRLAKDQKEEYSKREIDIYNHLRILNS